MSFGKRSGAGSREAHVWFTSELKAIPVIKPQILVKQVG
jgi:hypothetical protein